MTRAMSILLAAALACPMVFGVKVQAAEPAADAVVLAAAEAAVAGQGISPAGEQADTAFDSEVGEIVNFGTDSTITFTVPEGVEGTFDIYMNVGKASVPEGSKARTPRGSTVVTMAVADGDAYAVPMALQGCSEDPADLYNLGLFAMREDVELKAGETITLAGIAGNQRPDPKDPEKMITHMPPFGDMVLYPAGSEVAVGYDGGAVPEVKEADPEDVLSGLNIAWLGSSVTYGAASDGYSMADAMADAHAATKSWKYAISGTTLVNDDASSYVARMYQIDPSLPLDLFVVQLSTNDAQGKKPLGELGESMDPADFDDTTITGAMETIIAYVKETWGCPVFFYSGTHFDSPEYQEMVDRMLEIRDKWGIGVVDLWNNEEMTAVTANEEEVGKLMGDPVHPFRNGYVEWWLPEFEKAFTEFFTNNQ